MEAPNFSSCMADCRERVKPIRKESNATIGTEPTTSRNS